MKPARSRRRAAGRVRAGDAGPPGGWRRSHPMYAQDLAHIHHHGFGGFARGAAPGLLARLRGAGIRRGLVVDLGCGSGIWARALLDRGYDVLGIDPSPAMLALARRTAPGATLRRGTAARARIPACTAITALGEVLGYESGKPKGPSPLPAFFRRAARALPPGGLLVFDLIVAEGDKPMSYRTWTEGPGWTVLVEVAEEPGRCRLRRDIITFRRTASGHRRSRERHWVRLHRTAEVSGALREAGFTVRTARRYGRMALPPRRVAFEVRRRD